MTIEATLTISGGVVKLSDGKAETNGETSELALMLAHTMQSSQKIEVILRTALYATDMGILKMFSAKDN